MKRVFSVAISVALTGGVLLAQGQTPPQAPTQPPASAQPAGPAPGRIIQRVIVKVNGEPFTQTDYEKQLVNAIREKRPTVNDIQDLQHDPALIAQVQELTPDILVDEVDNLLLYQHGKELGYKMTDERFKTMVDGFKKQNKLDDAQLKAALAEEGLTMDTWREMAEKQSVIQQVEQEEIMQRAAPLDEERRQYYAAHPNEFMTPATITLHEITIAVPTQTQNGKLVFSAAEDEDVKKRATAVRDRILKGEDFAKVAGEVSDSQTKASGGVLGQFRLDELDPTMSQILGKLKVGDLTEPLRTAKGYQILKLDSKSDPQLQPFEAVCDQIAQKLYDQRLSAETRKFLVKVRAQALIQWYDDSLKQVYDKRLAERTAEGK